MKVMKAKYLAGDSPVIGPILLLSTSVFIIVSCLLLGASVATEVSLIASLNLIDLESSAGLSSGEGSIHAFAIDNTL